MRVVLWLITLAILALAATSVWKFIGNQADAVKHQVDAIHARRGLINGLAGTEAGRTGSREGAQKAAGRIMVRGELERVNTSERQMQNVSDPDYVPGWRLKDNKDYDRTRANRWLELGDRHRRHAGYFDHAVDAYREYLRHNPQGGAEILDRAREEVLQQRPKIAVELYELLREHCPSGALTAETAAAYYFAGNWPDARRLYAEALADTSTPRAWCHLARAGLARLNGDPVTMERELQLARQAGKGQ